MSNILPVGVQNFMHSCKSKVRTEITDLKEACTIVRNVQTEPEAVCGYRGGDVLRSLCIVEASFF